MTATPTDGTVADALPGGQGGLRGALEAVLRPRTIAVVGASRDRRTVGGDLFDNLVRGGFTGRLHPVNPAATEVQGVPAVASVLDIEGDVDLAIVVVPARAVAGVARECAR